jgi:hypothetical protein
MVRESTGESGTIHLTFTAIVNGIESFRNYLKKRKGKKIREEKLGQRGPSVPLISFLEKAQTAGQMTSCICLGIFVPCTLYLD